MSSPAPHPHRLDIPSIQAMLNTVLAALPPDPETGAAGQIAQCAAANALLGHLKPANPAEAVLAAHAVAGHFAAMDQWRRASDPELPHMVVDRLRRGARSLARMTEDMMHTLARRNASTRRSLADAFQQAAAAATPGVPAMRHAAAAAAMTQAAAAPPPQHPGRAGDPEADLQQQPMHLSGTRAALETAGDPTRAAGSTGTSTTEAKHGADAPHPPGVRDATASELKCEPQPAHRPGLAATDAAMAKSQYDPMHLIDPAATDGLAMTGKLGAPHLPGFEAATRSESEREQEAMHLFGSGSPDPAERTREPAHLAASLHGSEPIDGSPPPGQAAMSPQSWLHLSADGFAAHLRSLSDQDLLTLAEGMAGLLAAELDGLPPDPTNRARGLG